MFCKYCKKTNHRIEDCWKVQNKEKRNGNTRFKKSKMMNGGLLLMGDNTPCEVIGIGSVKIGTHDGMTRTPTDARHVPNIKKGIVRHHTIPHTPQQNGVAERMNRTIVSKARCMLSNAGMGGQFWAKAANTACHLINRSPSNAIDKKTPWRYDYSRLKVFGCLAYAHVDNGKLEPRAAKYIFLGYGSGVKGYKLWNPETKKSMLSRSVVFNESEMYYANHATNTHDDMPQKVSVQVENLDEADHVTHDDIGTQDTHIIDDDSPAVVHSSVLQSTQPMAVDRPARVRKPVRRLIEECNVSFALSCAEEIDCGAEPSTYTEAMISGDREKWMFAMQEEMQSLEKNGTWDIVRLPAGKKAVRCKWIFKRKEGSSPSETTRYKASQSAIHLTKDQMFHERTKHIDVKYHYVREVVAEGRLKDDYILLLQDGFVSRWRLLNCDSNPVEDGRVGSIAEARRREAWAGAAV
ncbi:hypothetical protein U9M48_027482, partial [Paspalum notatum var. saurae]